jgi:hypothetical protein
MPYEINWEKNGVLMRFLGIFNLKENNNATIEILDAPQFESVKYIIWDLSGISEQNMTEDEAVLVSMQDKLISSRLPKVKMALFAQDEHVRRICDKYVAGCHSRLTGWDFMVSDSMEKIRTWFAS